MIKILFLTLRFRDCEMNAILLSTQIPFLSCAGLAWTFILSLYAGSATKSHSPEKDMELQERSVETSSLEVRGKGGIVAGAR